MPVKVKVALALCVVAVLTLGVRAQRPTLGRAPLVPPGPLKTPLKLINAIAIPPFISSIDIMWVDQARARLYIADRSNARVDIINTLTDTFVGSVPGFISSSVGGTTNAGPNGVLVTPENILWAGDSNSTLQVADLNANPPAIIKSILIGSSADGRADELAYDPFDRIILIANDASTPPRVTFFSADTYAQLGQIKFPDADGMEQPIWDTQTHQFVINVPASPTAYEAFIDPKTMTVTKKFAVADCLGGPGTAGVNGLALGPFHQFLISACGNAYVMNGDTGAIINKVSQVLGGDEVWYNPGDGQYYVVPLGLANAAYLGVIDGKTAQWSQNLPAARLRNLAAYEGNNHIYSVATRPTVGTPDVTPCAQFNIIGTGCVAVFSH